MRWSYGAILGLLLIVCSACSNAGPPTPSAPLANLPTVTGGIPASPTAPPLTPHPLPDDPALAQQIKALLVEKVVKPASGGQVFCAYKVMDTEGAGQTLTSYLAVFCQEYYRQGEQVADGSGATDFAVLTVDISGATPRASEVKLPSLSNYNDEVRAMFPTRLHTKIFSREDIPALNAQARAEAEQALTSTP